MLVQADEMGVRGLLQEMLTLRKIKDESAEANDFIAEYICPIIKEVLIPSTRVTVFDSSTTEKKSYAFWKVAEEMVRIGTYAETRIGPGTETLLRLCSR
uniref:[Histone H3]-lysine(79) N-trimethyltransferase n=1 Tax=Caenorhabditis tropicalis TaxID=1561998 RepID=A0A1I7U207_9PELO